uniref:ABC-2 type transporter transmembrane domain-containing protein n=1 Tax=Anopheles minimus TaxID=112268 RepID=A0A182WC81_9DIPT
MTSCWSKFVLLLWKHWIIQKRRCMETVFEILGPVFCCAMFMALRGLVVSDEVLKPTILDRLNIGSLTDLEGTFPPESFSVAYSPQNEALEDLLNNAVEDEILTFRRVTIIPLVNARELESLLMQNNYIGGIEFPDSYANRTDLPQKLRFAVRLPGELRFTGWTFGNWRTNFMVVPFVQGLRNANQSDGGSPNYFREGFLTLQAAISRTFIRRQNADYPLPDVSLQRFPNPPFYEDKMLINMEWLLPMIILISFVYTCINTVKFITIEKEKQLKEAMKIMGLPNWLHWTAWFVRCLILQLITFSLLVFLISANLTSNTILSVFENADWTVLWFFFFTYSLVTICFCFMMSVFLDKANTAAKIVGIMWILFAIPFSIAVQDYDEMAMGTKIVSSLLSNTAMSFGIMNMIRLEASQVGLQWSNLFSPPSMGDDFSVGLVIVMFVVDALLYLAIALYFEQDAHCDKQRVVGILRKYIPEVRIETDIGTELSFVLREDYLKVFQPMLEELEDNMGSCGISSCEISLTTMEEVFLRPAGRDLPELKINFDGYPASLTVLETSVGQESVTNAFRDRFRQEAQQHQLVVTDEDMSTYILNKAAQDFATFNTRYWVGASLNSSICTAWFNNKAYHSAPLAVNLIYNAILQSICLDCFRLAFNTGFAMAFVSALFILFYIKERTSRTKLLQFVNGVNVTLFWAISYLWDYLVFVLSALFYIVTLAIIQQDG